MNYKRILAPFILLTIVFFCGTRNAPAETGPSGIVIAIPENPDECTAAAAAETAAIWERAWGKKVSVVREKNVPENTRVLYVGKTAAAKKAGADAGLTGNQSFRIRSVPRGVCIVGGSPLGTLYGIYEFLQRYCDIWYVAPGVEFIGKREPPSLAGIDFSLSPAIKNRRIYHAGYAWCLRDARSRWYEFDKRNRITSDEGECPPMKPYLKYRDTDYVVSKTPGRPVHNFFDYVPPRIYAKDHPEYFCMNRDGVRDSRRNAGGQLCLSNPDVFEIVYRHLEESIVKDRTKNPSGYPRVYDFSQEDNTNYLCCCPECGKIIQKYGHSDAGLLLWFVNKLAKRIHERYPDVFIRTYAYVSTEKLPEGIRAEDNVMIQYCDLYSKCNHLHPLTHPVNRERMELMKAWSERTKHLMVWDYILQSGNLPVSLIDAIPEDARFFRRHNIDWIFMETEFRNEGASFVHLKNFVLAQFYFNPDQDLEKLIDVYCRGFFGKAHTEMKAYLNYLRDCQNKNPTSDMNAWHSRDLRHINLEMLRTCRRMILNAGKKEQDPVIRLRILAEQNAADMALVNMLKSYPACAAERKALESKLTVNRIQVIDSRGLAKSKRDSIVKGIQSLQEEADLVFTDLPEALQKIPRTRIRFLGPSRLASSGRNASFTKDPDSGMSRVLIWKNPDPRKFRKTIGCGVYDRKWKKNFASRLHAVNDGKFHWHYVGRISLGPDSSFYALDWQPRINLKGFFLISDGADKDPNSYDLWVSVKFQGPAYSPGSSKENAVLFDRAMLVP